jgi:polyferredoxin
MYSVLLVVGAVVATIAFSTVRPANLGVNRMTGAPYIVTAEDVRNQYLVRIVNKRDTAQRFTLEVRGAPVGLDVTGFTATVEVAPLGEQVLPLVMRMPRSEYVGKFHLELVLHEAFGEYELKREMEFIGPDPKLLREDNP